MNVDGNGMVKLKVYEQGDFPALLQYVLPAEQAIYTSMPADAVKVCRDGEDNLAVLITEDEMPAGFFILDYGTEANVYTGNEEAVIFNSFSIDQRYQGRKIAVQAMTLLPGFVKQMIPQKNEILLTVHHTNIPARNLYEKCGFKDNGIKFAGESGEELVFHRPLKEPESEKLV
ncbi:GNAT family N-acetyltransferase [Peribacillus sp. B-H-3]|uniref:GNAT family N-acetyltransferase n=1 Tax=Peribacillus sp. B-H-3 TaxID=3400420 RepID=UPI003B011C9C